MSSNFEQISESLVAERHPLKQGLKLIPYIYTELFEEYVKQLSRKR